VAYELSETLYVDDYGMVDVAYVVHACLIDPEPDDDKPLWRIGLTLHVGQQCQPCCLEYPKQGFRDAAYEALVALVRAGQMSQEGV